MDERYKMLLEKFKSFEQEGTVLSEKQLEDAMSFPKEIIVNYFLGNIGNIDKAGIETALSDNVALLTQAEGIRLIIEQHGIDSWEQYQQQEEVRFEKFRRKISKRP